ncbi:MAG: TonB-dependent receptor [Pseudomonadota bacterium]
MVWKWAIGLIMVFFTVFPAAAGQTGSEKEDMGSITVEDETETVNLVHSPAPVSVIEMEKFHGRSISLNEVLKRVAGVNIRQEGGLGSNSTIAIQGLEGKRVKLFINGNPVNTPDGTFGINDIPIQLIERVEVYKGVVPAKFGGDALGGAVNVVTREFEGSYIDATASMGSYDTYRGAMVLKTDFKDYGIEWGVGGFFNQAANDYIMNSPYVDDLRIMRNHDKYTSSILATAVVIKERWFDEIEVELVRYESEKEIQGIETPVYEARSESAANILLMSFEKERFLTDKLAFEYDVTLLDLSLNYIDKAETCYDWDGTPRPCSGTGGEVGQIPHDSDDKQNDFRNDLNLHYILTNDYALNFHLNHQYSKYEPKDELANENLGYDIGAFPSEKTNVVLSLGFESEFLNGALANDIGIKSYHWDYSVTPQERGLSAAPAQSRNDGSEYGFYEAIRYEPVSDLFIKASYEHAYRLPNSAEIFGDGVTITSSPELDPEEADNFNIGILLDTYDFYRIPWLKTEVNFFYRDLKNMIKLEYGLHTQGYVNLGEVEVKGFETEIQTDITDNWYLYANYTNQSLTDQRKTMAGTIATPNPTYGHDIPNVPKQYGNLGAEFKVLDFLLGKSLFKLFWEFNWVDEYYYGWELSRHQERKIDSQYTHTAGLEYSFKDDRYILGFEVRNLTDEEVTDVFNYPLMGRSYHLNLRYSWFEK